MKYIPHQNFEKISVRDILDLTNSRGDDVKITIDGNWTNAQERKDYLDWLLEVLNTEQTYNELQVENEKLKERSELATDIAAKYSWIDGEHHKNWVINEMITHLLSSEDREKNNWNDPDWLEECIAP